MTFGFFMLVASGLVWTITGAMISHPARHRIATVSLLAPLLLARMVSAAADLRLPAILGDNMVLQCDLPTTIWGWAEAGEAMSVSLAGQTGQGVADADGSWRIVLPSLPASGPFEMIVAGHDRELTVRNILVGELWLASGQSNMAMGLSEKEVKDGAAEIAAADFPRLRLFTAIGQPSPTPLADLQGRWGPIENDDVVWFNGVQVGASPPPQPFPLWPQPRRYRVPGALVAAGAATLAVRYAWACNPAAANLYNADGLPAAPFRTDNWPGLTTGRN